LRIILILPATAGYAGEAYVGAKISIDSNGAVELNNVPIYDPAGDVGLLYADSGQR
jgi:hypothetical protein